MDTAVLLDDAGRVPALVCPGAQGCEAARARFQAGVAVRNVTPTVEPWTDLDGDGVRSEDEPYVDLDGDGRWTPVWLAGFSMGRAATGVHDPLWARVLTFRKGDLRVALVSLDLVGFFHDDVLRVREAVAARGVGVDHVLVATTHQHEGPDTMGLWGESIVSSGRNEAYIDQLIVQVADAVEEAARSEAPATLRVARGDAGRFVADSRRPIVIDEAITAVEVADLGGDVRAHLVVWGNHPEALADDNTLVTSDYPHYLRERLEAAYPGSRAVFFAGSLGGLMNPLGVPGCPDAQGEPTCRNGAFEKAAYIGEGAADVALAALRGPGAVAVEDPELALRRQSFLLPIGNLVFAGAFQLGILERRVFGPEGQVLSSAEVERLDLERALDGGIRLHTEVNHLRIGPLELLALPGEVYPELWLEAPAGGSLVEVPEGSDHPEASVDAPLATFLAPSPFRTVLNQANDALGYIIPKTQYDVERPRAYEPDGQYGEQNSLGPDTAPLLHEAVRALMALDVR